MKLFFLKAAVLALFGAASNATSTPIHEVSRDSDYSDSEDFSADESFDSSYFHSEDYDLNSFRSEDDTEESEDYDLDSKDLEDWKGYDFEFEGVHASAGKSRRSCGGDQIPDQRNGCTCPRGTRPRGRTLRCDPIDDGECGGDQIPDRRGGCTCPRGTRPRGRSLICDPIDDGECGGDQIPDQRGGCTCPRGTRPRGRTLRCDPIRGRRCNRQKKPRCGNATCCFNTRSGRSNWQCGRGCPRFEDELNFLEAEVELE